MKQNYVDMARIIICALVMLFSCNSPFENIEGNWFFCKNGIYYEVYFGKGIGIVMPELAENFWKFSYQISDNIIYGAVSDSPIKFQYTILEKDNISLVVKMEEDTVKYHKLLSNIPSLNEIETFSVAQRDSFFHFINLRGISCNCEMPTHNINDIR